MATDDRDDTTGLSRRRFLVGTGVLTAAGAALEARGAPGAVRAPGSDTFGPGDVTVELSINGQNKPVKIRPSQTLADTLRNELGLTGTKVVCDRGSCSACTVFIDSIPMLACTTFALDVVGRRVTTIEGLAKGGTLHPVQEAFIAHDALQCGFCTPGMVMSCAALLARTPNPTLDDVRSATSGNLCRCGTYPKVFEATLDAAKKATLSRKG